MGMELFMDCVVFSDIKDMLTMREGENRIFVAEFEYEEVVFNNDDALSLLFEVRESMQSPIDKVIRELEESLGR